MYQKTYHWIFAAVTAMTAGCDGESVEEVGGGDEVALRPHACPVWRCGFNSADVNGRAIRELNLDGVANSEGLRITGFLAPLGLLGNYRLEVENDALVARNPGGQTLKGAQLIGATILVQASGLLSLPVPITVLGYQEVDSWAAGAPKVPTYALLYPDLGALLGVRNVCSGDLLDTLASAATVLGGETYDLAAKTVTPNRNRWLTIACAGSAAAKMRLLGYGPQSSATTPAQRQATLKMVTADYCGEGVSYTQNGTEVHWANAGGTVAPGSTAELGDVEAVWNEDGALCLGSPRVAGTVTDCGLPSCAGRDVDDGEWVTYVAD
ncbi:ADYC domain-containing protein [Nannocystis bainbridge]|uniref:ADYC domain-containing protein n=1 Tax=Nannocystis bainbridge TaxID=2995303 RepID=A0ABT5E9I6_9BACT|nr:ADYC domain-containing protein [Nannocystis bainbridge]MDC0722090.1 ADYC domain-containing protein [Nannocystis bainbridge]